MPYIPVGSDVNDSPFKQTLIDPLAYDVLVRPVGHRLGVGPLLADNEGAEFFRKYHSRSRGRLTS